MRSLLLCTLLLGCAQKPPIIQPVIINSGNPITPGAFARRNAAIATSNLGGGVTITWCETQSGTRGTLDAGSAQTLGFSITNAATFHGLAQCTDQSNITAGSMVGWYDSPVYSWMQSNTIANWTLATSQPTSIGPDLTVTSPYGRFLYATSGVTCSGGSWDGGVLVCTEYLNQ